MCFACARVVEHEALVENGIAAQVELNDGILAEDHVLVEHAAVIVEHPRAVAAANVLDLAQSRRS